MAGAVINQIFAACLSLAAQQYQIPPAILVGILHVEGGRIGQAVGNKNGSYDLGPMQVNTLWMPVLAKSWNVTPKVAMRWVRDDGCTNVNVAAWILRQHLDETKSLSKAVSYYHSRTPHLGARYKNKVVAVLRKKGLLNTKGMPLPPTPQQAGQVVAVRSTEQGARPTITQAQNTQKAIAPKRQHIVLRLAEANGG